MLIKKVVLHNIRSYVDAEINFGAGKTLIAGDIGAGKSTILLAIEFTLFGLLKGEITGSTLLRHGTNAGFAELHFELNNKEIIIHRTLKKNAKGIEQDAGFIVQNSKKESLMPTELKAIILNLLGYPEELLAKSKNNLFRYTIYTPQEEMKKILFGDNEERINIIRRIFNIDKYKRTRENADIYAKNLRDKNKEAQGRIADLNDKKTKLQTLETELAKTKEILKIGEQKLASAKLISETRKKEIQQIEQNKKQHNELKHALEMCTITLQHLETQKTSLQNEIKQSNEKITPLKQELANHTAENPEEIKQKIVQKNNELSNLEAQKIMLVSENASTHAIQNISTNTIRKIQSIDVCPTCLQKVDEKHKQEIMHAENTKIAAAKEKQTQTIIKHNQIETNIAAQKNEINILNTKEKTAEIAILKQKQLEENTKRTTTLTQTLEKAEQEITQTVQKKQAIEKDLQNNNTIEEQYTKAKKELESALSEERNAEIQHNILKEKNSNLENNKKPLETEIKEKEKIAQQAEQLKRASQWLTEFFTPLVESIEKQVLARVYNEFNTLFVQWFEMLVDDELLSARLDDSFAPVLQQNGYDTLPENLSGGEKTACALAYRLALNKVINDLMTLVQTKDLIVLDEPTDGFSDAQLDKVRDVLDNLSLKQAIIVSHEKKVESFVDQIIHIEKQRHQSRL